MISVDWIKETIHKLQNVYIIYTKQFCLYKPTTDIFYLWILWETFQSYKFVFLIFTTYWLLYMYVLYFNICSLLVLVIIQIFRQNDLHYCFYLEIWLYGIHIPCAKGNIWKKGFLFANTSRAYIIKGINWKSKYTDISLPLRYHKVQGTKICCNMSKLCTFLV